ncbi:MAG TPA: hypothetical protein VIL34_17670 [Actinopolymorphaceae bacterium]
MTEYVELSLKRNRGWPWPEDSGEHTDVRRGRLVPGLRRTPTPPDGVDRATPLGDVDVAASPEWFGDGWKAFRQILFRRELAELIASASPRDFDIQPVS